MSGQLHVQITLTLEKEPRTDWTEDSVGPGASLDAESREIYLASAGNRTSTVQTLARRYAS
jgi:hypothetical protein